MKKFVAWFSICTLAVLSNMGGAAYAANISYNATYPSYGDFHWKAPVASVAALPTLNNVAGDARVETTAFGLYLWTGSAWSQVGGSSSPVTSVTATPPIRSSGGTTPNITCDVASGSQPGCLSAADWTTFNNKQSTLTLGNLTDAGTDGIIVTSGSGAVIGSGTSLAQHVSDSSHNGYLSSADWSTFNGKQASGNYITALTGQVTASGPGSVAATIAANTVTNSNLAQMATLTIKGNNTGGTANALDLTVSQVNTMLGTIVNPLTTLGDTLYENATPAPTRLAGNTTAVKQFYTQTGTGAVSAAPAWSSLITPTVQTFTSGTAQTYTTPAGVLYIRVRAVGGGGGGAGSGTSGAGAGGSGTATTFGTSLITANPGTGASAASGTGGAGGTAAALGAGAIGTCVPGSQGYGLTLIGTITVGAAGGAGGSSPYYSGAGAPVYASAGGSAAANTGAGGAGGGASTTASDFPGSGGGSGSFCEAEVVPTAAQTFAYTVGAVGAGGTAGTNGFAAGSGAAGYIEVTEYRQ